MRWFNREGASGFSASSTAEQVTQGIDGTNLTAILTGIMATPFMLSKDNIELRFATNHIGHFLLTNLLLETMRRTARESNQEGRIVNASSHHHQFSYPEGIQFDKVNDQSILSAYGQSKPANILHANELARCLKTFPLLRMSWLSGNLSLVLQEDRVEKNANSLDPGAIATNLLSHHSFLNGLVGLLGEYAIKNVQQGAATIRYCALHLQGMSGFHFADYDIAQTSSQANNSELAKRLCHFSLDLVVNGCSHTS